MQSNLLQRLVLPTPTTPEPLLYARTSGEVRLVEGGAVLADGGALSFDTSFGVFAAGRWRRVSQVNNLMRSSQDSKLRKLRWAGGRGKEAMEGGRGQVFSARG